MATKPKLDRWIIHGNVVVGFIYDHHAFGTGEHVMTDAIVEISPETFEVRCVDGDYLLGEPGTMQEHTNPMLDWNTKKKACRAPSAPANPKQIIVGI